MFPTPQANEDATGTPEGKMQRMLGNCEELRGKTKEEWATGTLNPTWVEWLMGWPIGWTDLNALETDKFLMWPHTHGNY
jgi:DNA (cytosine-5)-methyltransferase 1